MATTPEKPARDATPSAWTILRAFALFVAEILATAACCVACAVLFVFVLAVCEHFVTAAVASCFPGYLRR